VKCAVLVPYLVTEISVLFKLMNVEYRPLLIGVGVH